MVGKGDCERNNGSYQSGNGDNMEMYKTVYIKAYF